MGVAVQGGAVPFYDFAGKSPKFGGDRNGRTAEREGHFDWANIDALIAELTPPAPALPGLYPGSSILYVNNYEIECLADEGEKGAICGDVIGYLRAKAKISYGKLDYTAETLVTRRWSFTGEFMTLPASSVKWDNGDPVENEEISAAKIIPMIEHSLTRQRAPTIPWTAIKECIGKVNLNALDDAIFTDVDAETLLFMGSQIDWTLSTDGSEVWTLEHRFQERRVKHAAAVYGWNHFWRPDKKRWEKLKDDNGDNIYPKTNDFEDLF